MYNDTANFELVDFEMPGATRTHHFKFWVARKPDCTTNLSPTEIVEKWKGLTKLKKERRRAESIILVFKLRNFWVRSDERQQQYLEYWRELEQQRQAQKLLNRY